MAVLVRESRADKLLEISTGEVRQRQIARLTPEDVRTLDQLRDTALRGSRWGGNTQESASPSLLYAQEHIFERVSVAEEHELLTEALRHGRGRVHLRGSKRLAPALNNPPGGCFGAGRRSLPARVSIGNDK